MKNLKENMEKPDYSQVKIFQQVQPIYCCTSSYNYNINGGNANINSGIETLNLSNLCKEFDSTVYPYLQFTMWCWSVSRRSSFFHTYVYTSVETNTRRICCPGIDASDQMNTFDIVVGPDRKMTLRKDASGDQIEIVCSKIQPMKLKVFANKP